jgi:hypothetical protein
MKSAVFAALLLASAVAHADDLQPEVRIQRRFVDKLHRFSAFAGVTYHARGDYYLTPGIEVAGSYYVLESLALELRGAWFFARPSQELLDVVAQTGYLPDTRPCQADLLFGARYSLGYAKMKVSSHAVLHFEPQVFVYGGINVTAGDYHDTQVAPLADLGLGFLVHLSKHIEARVDAGFTIGGEQRTTYVAVLGALPSLMAGVLF